MALLAEPEVAGGDEDDDDEGPSDDWQAGWRQLDDTCRELAFAQARTPPALRAKRGAAGLRDAAALLERQLNKKKWARGEGKGGPGVAAAGGGEPGAGSDDESGGGSDSD